MLSSQPGPTGALDPRKHRILYVDADSLNRKLRTKILEGAGHSAVSFGSLSEAMIELVRNSVGLLVIDENAADGVALENALANHPQLPVLLLKVTSAGDGRARRVRNLCKLDGPEAFLRAVEELLRAR